MRLRVLQCPQCGAPLPRRALLVRLVCEYCKAEVTVDRHPVKAVEYRAAWRDYAADGAADMVVGGVAIRLLGRIAQGHSSDVFAAERTTRLSERLVVKVLRAGSDASQLEAEWASLAALLQSKARGTPHFSTLLPQPVAHGPSRGARFSSPLSSVFREAVGFAHTLADVQRAYPRGVDPRHLVWLWRRSLELLGWVHESGWIHGAILPEHVLIDARQHGVRFVGWSCAAREGTRATLVDARQAGLYPRELLDGGALTARSDLTMLARCLLGLVTGATPPPRELAALLDVEARGEGGNDAYALGERVAGAARACFGRPRFVELALP